MRHFIYTLLLLAFYSGLTTGCSQLTPEEKSYLARVDSTQTTWKIPRANVEELRGKAQAYINRYSPMKVLTVTDYVINTDNPPIDSYGYFVTLEPTGDSVAVTIQGIYCAKSENATPEYHDAVQNSRIMALYLQTGEIMPRYIRP
jgi:hypothetical protein